MGLLNTYFAAADGTAALAAVGPGGPEGFDAGGFTGVELEMLFAILSGTTFDELLGSMPQPLGDDPDAEQWTIPIRPELTAALAELSFDARPAVAERWAATEELAAGGFTPDDAADLLDRLAFEASSARAAGNRLYLWISL